MDKRYKPITYGVIGFSLGIATTLLSGCYSFEKDLEKARQIVRYEISLYEQRQNLMMQHNLNTGANIILKGLEKKIEEEIKKFKDELPDFLKKK